jgi:hypothetical protein
MTIDEKISFSFTLELKLKENPEKNIFTHLILLNMEFIVPDYSSLHTRL